MRTLGEIVFVFCIQTYVPLFIRISLIVTQMCGLHMTRLPVGFHGLSFIFTLVLLGVDWLCFIQNRTGIWHKQIQLWWSWTWLHRDTHLGKGIDGIEQICILLWMKW